MPISPSSRLTSIRRPRPVTLRSYSAASMPIGPLIPPTRSPSGIPEFGRRPAGFAVDAQRAGQGLQDDVEGRPVAQRAGHAEARDRAVDQPRIDRGQRFIAQAEAIHDAGAIVFDQDVAFGREILDQRHAGLGLQIDDDALLAAVHAQKIVALVRRGTAETDGFRRRVSGRLDLQHLRAEIGQRERGRRSRQHASEVENTNSLQGTGPARSSVSCMAVI